MAAKVLTLKVITILLVGWIIILFNKIYQDDEFSLHCCQQLAHFGLRLILTPFAFILNTGECKLFYVFKYTFNVLD